MLLHLLETLLSVNEPKDEEDNNGNMKRSTYKCHFISNVCGNVHVTLFVDDRD